jgi:flagellar hook-associated protein 2
MATISFGGLATGVDTDALIQQLLAVEQAPLNLLSTRKVKYQALSTAFQDLNNKLLTVKTAADNLRDPAKFFARSVTSSDDTVATATATSGEMTGTFTLTALSLARGSIAAAASTKAALTDTIAAGDGTFTFTLGATGAEKSVAVTATTTLEQLVKAINDTAAGVKATAVNVGTGAVPAYKLTLTSTGTGTANDIVIVNDGTTLGVTNTQAADDASFSITGLGTFTRSTNTISDAIDGVTITLKDSSGSTDLALSYDKASTESKVRGLLDAYNAAVSSIDAQSAVKTGSDGKVTAGAFSGDSVTRVLRAGLASAMASTLAGVYGRLTDVGITTQRDGTLALDSTKFKAALDTDSAAVARLFSGTGTQGGILDLLYEKADTATKSITGTIAVRRDGITATMRSLQAQIDRGTARLATTEQTLRARFAALEQLVARTQSSGNALISALNAMTRSNED